MSGALVRYDQACRAVAEAKRVDEVLQLRTEAEMREACAHIAGNKQIEIDAAEIRLRAERRLGKMLIKQREAGLLHQGGRPAVHRPETPQPEMAQPETPRAAADAGELSELPEEPGPEATRFPHAAAEAPITEAPITLAEAGIDKNLADRARKSAAKPAEVFEAELADRRRRFERDDGKVPVNLVDDTAERKKARRAQREADLGASLRDLPARKYGVILADPEWEYEVWSPATGSDRAAANHYPTSPLAAICARDVAAIAAPDCLLALWAVVPMLAEAYCVLDAWGFARFERDPATGFLTIDKSAGRYVSSGVWTKYRPKSDGGSGGIGMGHWFRVDHEILILATRGQPPAPERGTQARSIFDVPASRVHSQKPELVAEILEGYFPSLPKIELNRRGPPRPGWDAWGNEALAAEAAA